MKASLYILTMISSLYIFIPSLPAFAFTGSRRRTQPFVGKRSVIVHLDNKHVKARSDDIETKSDHGGNHDVALRGKNTMRTMWLDQSISYYSKVMREERRRNLGQVKDYLEPAYQEEFEVLAKKHYFALRKIKDGKPRHAELIYRRIIDELLQEEEGHCDHAKLAVTTLLLALLLQRSGDRKATRSVFLSFFRVAVLEREENTECACSAKVLQAYALFEMKQGNARKSFELVKKAIAMDRSLEPVLQWKQFRDVLERKTLHPSM